MMSELKGKSVKETLKKLGAKTLPAKPGKDIRKSMRKLPAKPDKDIRESMRKLPRDFYNKDVDNEEIPRMLKLKKGGSTNFIQKAIKKPGALRAQLGAKKGEPIPAKKLAAAVKKPGKLGQRARLAQTLKGFKK